MLEHGIFEQRFHSPAWHFENCRTDCSASGTKAKSTRLLQQPDASIFPKVRICCISQKVASLKGWFASASPTEVSLRKAIADLKALEAKFREELRQAKTSADRDIIESDWGHELQEAELDVAYFKTKQLREKCWDLDIPFPEIGISMLKSGEGSDLWQRSNVDHSWSLTKKGIHSVRAALRAEQTSRFEAISRWVLLASSGIAALTGLVGALIGLASLSKNERVDTAPIVQESPLGQSTSPVTRNP